MSETVEIQTTTNEVEVSEADDQDILVVTAEPVVTTAVVSLGIQGPAGPTGPQGPPGGNYSQYVTNSASFTITHNLGYYPSVSWIDESGEAWIPDITYVSLNSVAFLFPSPVTGTAIFS